jgi:hypothetical protein
MESDNSIECVQEIEKQLEGKKNNIEKLFFYSNGSK